MSKVKCDHCHLEFSDSVMIHDGDHRFCCKGCQGIFHLLQDEGLESFYAKMGDTTLAPPTEQFEASTNFDTPAFAERFITMDKEGLKQVSLVIEGIHCAACVWLNEKALHKLPGVIEAHINYTNNKARITWDGDTLKLSAIIDMIRAIGYNAFPYDATFQEVRANKERKDYYLRMAVATFATMNMMWIAVAQYAGYFTGIAQDVKTILNVAEWFLATPVLFYSGWVFYRGAYYGLRNKAVTMDLLVVTGSSLAYLYSIYITVFEKGEAYFDSVAMIVTFVLFGKFLEVLSRKNAADTLDVMSKHIPSEVSIVEGESVREVNVSEVKVGDVIRIRSGEKAAIDGEVLSGEGSFDESNLTGESEPIFKRVGDLIISGTTSIDAVVNYRASKDFANSTLSHLVNLLENAMSKKPHIEQLANRLSQHFSSTILFLAIATFWIWYFWPHSFDRSLMVGISVIIIACPCALALATPVATLVGLALGAKRGILFKSAAQIETMAKATMVVLDKTGTITQGRPEVVYATIHKGYDVKELYSLVRASKHPISRGVAEYLERSEGMFEQSSLDEVREISARGVVARSNTKMIAGGNALLMDDLGIKIESFSEQSLFYYAIEGELIATFELRDLPKERALESIEALKQFGLRIVMLTGDHESAAMRVAGEVGITEVHAHLIPEQKAEFIAQAHNEGYGVVMAGDGVNDLLALARADIGIAMGSGSDIAIEVSDVVLLNDSLTSLVEAFAISRRTYGLIKQNLGISLLYNSITIPLAMMGYVIPLIAAISMSFSSLLVVSNSMRSRWMYK
ncbi:MAG: heavy metal translocating P-type ATPase [Sulfuricurvum sp.]|uniref:heavy metal translocating P-type ATPase n=1 Tax=Sulfuricurvum sp. TaxID=2025608 RepID=UPI00262265C1|nr:heavy metal translocating P-type ATPase [Sulfuricurvum sp.]MDD2828615.1 heavy metal translocating P-type ATPase [Sulfuricurvum sp.]MDD4948292.1 heavy metal translocating P-type ATPase [Sulfuricurvum sp.]